MTTVTATAPPRSAIPRARHQVPLLGNLPEYLVDSLRFLQRVARRDGDLVELRFPRLTSYLVSHPADIEHVLVSANKSFIKDSFLRDLRRVIGDGLLTSEGDFWRRQRRLAQPAFHRDRIAVYAEQMVESTDRMLATWKAGEVRDLHVDMMRLTLDIVSRTLFSADVAGDARNVIPAVEAIMARFGAPLLMLIPQLGQLPLPANRRLLAAEHLLDDIIHRIVRRRRAAGAGDHGDLLSMLLAAQDVDGSQMTDKQIRDEVITLFLAGHETTALALSWAFYLLSQHPEVEARLAAELRDVLGARAPTLEDVPQLTYTEQVITETMRLYPPAWSIGREAIEPVEIHGYRVPVGAQVWMSQWVVHRDPRWFDDAESFRPDRWADGLAKRLPKFAYFPFGGGPRICIGNSFAMMEATLLLARIAQRFRPTLAPGARVATFPSITLRPRYGMKMQITPQRS